MLMLVESRGSYVYIPEYVSPFCIVQMLPQKLGSYYRWVTLASDSFTAGPLYGEKRGDDVVINFMTI